MAALVFCCLLGRETAAQQQTVSARVKLQSGASSSGGKAAAVAADASDAVVWLIPLDPEVIKTAAAVPAGKRIQVVQRNKTFVPHMTALRVGSVVDFPNRDPFFHNVFSLFDGKRFDLGLYEAGSTNSVRFDHPGVSYLFCNIHPEMSAVVVAVDTPYYGLSDKSGGVAINGVPDGKYEMHVWYERGVQDALKELTRTLHISAEHHDAGLIAIPQDPAFTPAHKNKYGQDYPPPPKPGYPQP